MTAIKHICLLIATTALLLAGANQGNDQIPASVRESDDIAVVVSARNQISHLSLPELRAILLGERHFWKNQVPIVIVLREPKSRERELILKKVLGMNESAFKAHWRRKLFRAEAVSEPMSVSSNSLALEYLDTNPGAITFLAGKNLRPDSKVVMIERALPGVPGYPFR